MKRCKGLRKSIIKRCKGLRSSIIHEGRGLHFLYSGFETVLHPVPEGCLLDAKHISKSIFGAILNKGSGYYSTMCMLFTGLASKQVGLVFNHTDLLEALLLQQHRLAQDAGRHSSGWWSSYFACVCVAFHKAKLGT